MKKIILLFILGFNYMHSQNLINNGDFESWNNGVLSYWKLSPTSSNNSNASQFNGGGINGSKACILSIGQSINSTGRISQYMTVPNRYTKVTFKYKYSSNASGKSLKIQLHRPVNPYPSTVIAYSEIIQSNNVNTWQTYSIIYDITSNSSVVPPYSLALYILPDSFDFNNLGAYIIIDDVQVISSNNLAALSTVENKVSSDLEIINPVKDKLLIKTKEKIEKVIITNLNGQLVKTFNHKEYNVSDLTRGTYLVNIHTNKEIIIKKIIKD